MELESWHKSKKMKLIFGCFDFWRVSCFIPWLPNKYFVRKNIQNYNQLSNIIISLIMTTSAIKICHGLGQLFDNYFARTSMNISLIKRYLKVFISMTHIFAIYLNESLYYHDSNNFHRSRHFSTFYNHMIHAFSKLKNFINKWM